MKMSGRCRQLPSIAKHLGAEGYHSTFYYGGDIDFTNMRGYLFETGYEKVLGGENYSWAPNQSKWGADDEYLLALTPNPLPAAPFFATYLTLSSHEPWVVPYRRLQDNKANAFAYTDSCIYTFVRQLKQSGLWNNLLLIVIPDHGVDYGQYHTYSVQTSRIPILWLGGAVRSARVVDLLMNQSDLAATLMAQLGVKANDFIFSRNVLSPGYASRRQFALHAYKNGANLFTPDGVSGYDCVDHSPLGPSPAGDSRFTEALLQYLYHITADLPRR
jgi:phosphoglycerol transferase MdoB-like AlkP superfamily enzyme